MSGEAERATAVQRELRAQAEADLRGLLAARLSEAMDEHTAFGFTGECECGWVEPYGLGLGPHQLDMAAAAVLELLRGDSTLVREVIER